MNANTQPNPWPPEDDALIRKHAKTLSAGQIGRLLSIPRSRSAVCGRAFRLKINLSKDPQTRSEINRAPKPPRAARQFGTREAPVSAPKPPAAPYVEPVIPDNVIRLAEPEAHTCKWPLGEPAANDFGWCSRHRAPGAVYCAEHARVAHQPSKKAASGKPVDPSRELERALRRWL